MTPPPPDSLGFLLTDATRAIRRRFEQRAACLGLSSSQWRLLMQLKRGGPLPQARLAELLEIEPISVSRLVDRMQEAGWVRREPDATDRRVKLVAPTEKAMQWPDALGLGLFSATGTQLALAQDLPGIVAVLMGVITATFGGVLRDVVCNEIPTAFSDHRPYAICAFIGGWVLVLAQHAGLAASLALVLGAACATGLRVAALLTGFTLPRWSSGDAA